jgi:competence protein ComEC
MAMMTGAPPSTGFETLQTARRQLFADPLVVIERALEKQQAQLPLWLPIFFGLGIALWFVLPTRMGWVSVIACGFGFALAGIAYGASKRLGFALIIAGLMTSTGCGLVWWRAVSVGGLTLTKPQIAEVSGRIIKVERLAAREQVRLRIKTEQQADAGKPALPSEIRVSIRGEDALLNEAQSPFAPGMRVRLKAWLMPPAEPAVPGAYDFARAAWFMGLGATGKVLGPVERLDRGEGGQAHAQPLRRRLADHVAANSDAATAGIAIALVSGEQGRVSATDQEAMRASGLAHLLSISGLHITAVVGAAMLLALRLLALSPRLALHWPLPVIAAGFGAAAGIGYTLLSGAEVPTVRSCIAALLVLIGLAIGREAMTLRLVAVGALVVLVLWPEALIGPSFQLSFAAITALIALHELPVVKRMTARRDEKWMYRIARMLLSLLLTGLAVEAALMPIALYHFHRTGIYGALVNIVAIPLTTFVIMPLEAAALAFGALGIGAPFWWMTDQAIALLLWIAHAAAAAPGAVAMIPTIPVISFAAMIIGGLWLLLWRGRMRLWGLLPCALSIVSLAALPPPDLLVTRDGRHVVVRGPDGRYAMLRPRAGDYVRDTLAERGGAETLDEIDDFEGARCSADSCLIEIARNEGQKRRTWRILATRSGHLSPWRELMSACQASDIVISDRKLPDACAPRWFKADRVLLSQTGGIALTLSPPRVETALSKGDEHPWRMQAGP